MHGNKFDRKDRSIVEEQTALRINQVKEEHHQFSEEIVRQNLLIEGADEQKRKSTITENQRTGLLLKRNQRIQHTQ